MLQIDTNPHFPPSLNHIHPAITHTQVLDECTPFNVEKEYTADSMRRSHRWALRSLREMKRTDDGKQALYVMLACED